MRFHEVHERAVIKRHAAQSAEEYAYWNKYLTYLAWIEEDYDDLEWFVNGLIETRQGPEHDALLDCVKVYLDDNMGW